MAGLVAALVLATVAVLVPDAPETPSSPESTAAPASDEVRWVAPAATGSGDGSAAADAADLSALPRLVSDMPQGGRVRLRADQGAYEVRIPLDEADQWLRTLTSVRLAVATRLGITDAETADELAELSEDDPRAFMLSVYDWLGFAQETLISAL